MKYILAESNLKKYIEDKFNLDLSGSIFKINHHDELPYPFSEIPNHIIQYYLENGPMYLIKIEDDFYLCSKIKNNWIISDETDREFSQNEFLDKIGIGLMGLKMDDLIELYFVKRKITNEGSIFKKINDKLKNYFDDRSEDEKHKDKIKIEVQKLINLIVDLYYKKFRPNDKRIIKSLTSHVEKTYGDKEDDITVYCQYITNDEEFDYGSYYFMEANKICQNEIKKIYEFAKTAGITSVKVDGKTYNLKFVIMGEI